MVETQLKLKASWWKSSSKNENFQWPLLWKSGSSTINEGYLGVLRSSMSDLYKRENFLEAIFWWIKSSHRLYGSRLGSFQFYAWKSKNLNICFIGLCFANRKSKWDYLSTTKACWAYRKLIFIWLNVSCKPTLLRRNEAGEETTSLIMSRKETGQ